MEHLHPKKAFEILQANPNTLLIDCRTEAEFYYVGHPVDAVNIEWNTEPDFEINPHFSDVALRMAGRKVRRPELALAVADGSRRIAPDTMHIALKKTHKHLRGSDVLAFPLYGTEYF